MKHIIFVLALSMPLYAQLPEAPKPRMDKTELTLLTIDASSRALDVYSTHQMLENGGYEIFLPDAISHHTPLMALYSAGSVALDWFIAHKLKKHGHRRLAHALTMIDIGQDAPWAIHNLFIRNNQSRTLPRFK